MNDTLLNNLAKQFESHRVVFWYDPSSEFSDQLDVMPDEVTLIRASEYNDFAIKYRLLTEEPKKKFLVYYEKDEPEYEDNWLLDIQLANTVFRTDKESILLSDLDLPHSFIGTLRMHLPFFSNKRLVKKLGTLVSNDMSEDAFEHLLLAITAGEDSFNLQMVIDSLVVDYADDGELYETVKEYGLNQLLWDDIASLYGYAKENPSIEDFYLSVFETSLQHFLGAQTALQADAYGLLKHWKDSGKFKDSGLYKTLSEKAAEELSAPKHLADIPTETLSTFDDYAFVEEEIIARLTSSTLNQTMGLEAIRQIAERRRSSFWYSEYSSAYQSIVLAKTMLDSVKNISFTIDSPDAGISKYVKEWSHIDNAYRNFKIQVRGCLNTNSDMEALSDKVESYYVTNFLIPLGEKWTPFAKEMLENGWRTEGGIQRQRIFYHYNIKNLQIRGNKAVVLISDAMRYEIGDELVSEINSQQRYKASIQPLLAAAPTYTQLGMAALLPHEALTISPDGSSVYADGVSTQGIVNREKILKNAADGKAVALDSDDVLRMKSDDLRTVIKDNSVIYVYHDLIDREGEDNLFKAAHEAIDELKNIIRKLGSSNANTIYVTADHGFLFQESDLESHQYISDGSVRGKDVHQVSGRRCAIGYDLEPSDSLMISKLKDIGLSNEDDLEVAFPNSILRMRVQGANTNFVHGGLSLQEIIIPLIKVDKARKDDITDVSIEILTNLKTITTGSVAVTFFQEDYVSDKVQGYEATFGFYSQDGTAISDIEKRTVASEAIDPKKREFQIVFYLNKESEKYNRRPVFLRIQKILPSGRTALIAEKECILSRSMSSDFDF